MQSVLATFGVCLLSALVPVVNAEVALVAVALVSPVPPLVLALVAGLGQMVGKMLFYLLGRDALDPERWRRWRREGTATGRWATWTARVREWAERHTWGPAALTGVSALTGLPPFAVVSVLAGTLRMRWWVFAGIGFAGRSTRFLLVLLAPGLLPSEWLARVGLG